MFKKVLIIIILGATALIFFSIIFLRDETTSTVNENRNGMSKISIANKDIFVDIADEPNEQIQGLSGRVSMAEDEGMLFIFPNSFVASFWMKEMNFSLDLVWIDADAKIIGIEKKRVSRHISQNLLPYLAS